MQNVIHISNVINSAVPKHIITSDIYLTMRGRVYICLSSSSPNIYNIQKAAVPTSHIHIKDDLTPAYAAQRI